MNSYRLTRDLERIPTDKVWEYDKDGYVVSSFRLVWLDFNKEENG